MKAKFSLIVGGLAAACLVGVLIYSTQKTKDAETLNAAARQLAKTTGAPSAPQTVPPEQQFRQYMSFDRDMRRFLRNHEDMTPAEIARQTRDLSRRIDEREKSRHLSAGEALKLKMALIRVSEPDEEQQALQFAELIAHYRVEAEQRQAQFLDEQRRDTRFQAYKAREAQIVAEVQAMRSFPAGVSRDEYLRQRLFEARAAIYSALNPPKARRWRKRPRRKPARRPAGL